MTSTNLLDKIQDNLNTQLKDNLPGIEAHLKMAPIERFREVQNYIPNEKTKISSVMICIYPHENSLFFPLIVRPENTGVHSGQVALPGGKKDEEDEDLIATAIRETWEEVGVNIDRTQVLGQLSQLYIPPSNFLVKPTIAILEEKPNFTPSPHEVAQLLEVDLIDFKNNDYRQEGEIIARYMKRVVPFYGLHNQKVWGATAMILSEFLEILKKF